MESFSSLIALSQEIGVERRRILANTIVCLLWTKSTNIEVTSNKIIDPLYESLKAYPNPSGLDA